MTDTTTDSRSAPSNILDGWIEEHDLAVHEGVAVRTLRERRKKPDGPPFRYLGKRVIYHVETYRKWLEDGLIRPNPTRQG